MSARIVAASARYLVHRSWTRRAIRTQRLVWALALLTLCLSLLVLSSRCSWAPAAGAIESVAAKLPALATIATPDNAKRALHIAQAVRVGYRDFLATKLTADDTITDTELAIIAKFNERDERFTRAWARAHTAALAWGARGSRLSDTTSDWAIAYHELETVASEWQLAHGSIGPVLIQGGRQ